MIKQRETNKLIMADNKSKHTHTHSPNGGSSQYSQGGTSSLADPDLVRVRKKHKKRHKGLKIFLIILAVILAACLGIGIAVALWLNSVSDSMKMSDQDRAALSDVLTESSANDPYYVLLLGSDARANDAASRSDTMILARVDARAGKVTLVSIPRDTKVEIPGHGTQKINAAYAFGGAAGAVEAVEDFAGVEISHYVEIHFDELETAVDELGGVWIKVPVSNNQTGASNTGVELNAGTQRMNGEQALAFARERYGYNEGDFQRAENQRLLVQAIADQVLSLPATDLPGAVQSLASCVSTDYSLNDLVTLAQTFQSAERHTFYSAMVPSTTQTIDGVSYTITLEDEWANMMQMVDTGQDPSTANVLTNGTKAVGEPSDSIGNASQ